MDCAVYLTVAGLNNSEGAVLTRNRNGTDESGGNGVWAMDKPPASWYRLETNFDNWRKITDGRRAAAHKSMDALGQAGAANFDGLLEVLGKPPVLASDTTYTAFMSAALGVYGAVVRSHPGADAAELQARVKKKGAHIRQLMTAAFPALRLESRGSE
jgi:hypothetical protein